LPVCVRLTSKLKSALKGAQEYLGQQPDGNMQAQVMALVSELGINVPGWTAPALPRPAPPSEASFVLVTPSPSVAPSPQPAGDRKTITEALIMICQEIHVPHPPDVDLMSALKEAQQSLGLQPDGNSLQAQVKALVKVIGINVPGWTDR
jgi:hypothetical protein